MNKISHWTATRSASVQKASKGFKPFLLSPKDFLLTQASICSSVALEENSSQIRPECSKFINSNAEGWSNESLQANFPSYVGAWNYVDHVQEPEKSAGFLADAQLRRRYLNKERNLFVYYVDLLVATHKDHKELTDNITLGKIQYMSMGCTTYYSRCSRCGQEVEEDAMGDALMCDHLHSQKGQSYFDNKGIRRITAELMGNEKPGSCVFTEASWLTMPPAFGGAVLRNLLPVKDDVQLQINIPENVLDKPAIKKYLG